MNRLNTHLSLFFVPRGLEEMLDFPVNFKYGPVTDFRPKLSQVPHDALKLRRAPGKFFYEGAKIGLLVGIEPITNNAKTRFQGFEIFFHSLMVAFRSRQCNLLKNNHYRGQSPYHRRLPVYNGSQQQG